MPRTCAHDRSSPPAGLRLMHVHAHPDDESSKGAASTAKYVAEGVDVHVATCTGGERGSILNPKMDRPDVLENITEIRRQEMERARDILGVRQDWLGFVDSGWPEGDPQAAAARGLLRAGAARGGGRAAGPADPRVPPHVMTTYDERGGYPHPDHVKCHEIAVAAFEAAGDPERYPELGEPWQPLKLYYHHSFNRPADAGAARRDDRARARVAVGGAAQGVEARARVGRPDHHPGARAPTTSASATRRCSRTPPRSTRTGSGSRSRASCRQKVWPTEDFELVTSLRRAARCPRTTCSPASLDPPERLGP